MEKGEEDQRPDSPEPIIQFIKDKNKEKKKEDRLALLMKIVKANGQSLPYGRVNEELIQNLLRQIAGITPLVISVLNDQDALLEFEGNVIVTSVCRALQGPLEWEGEELDICCMAGEKYHLVEIEKSREEFRMKQEELRGERQQLEEQERAAREQLELQSSQIKEDFQQQKEDLDQLAAAMKQQMADLLKLREELRNQGPNGQEKDHKLTKPPEFPRFSGDEPTPKEECSFETFLFQVQGARKDVTEQAVRSALISAVRGGASAYLEYVGLDSPLDVLIDRLKERYDAMAPHDTLVCQFHQLNQERHETIRDFAGRIEKVFRKLHAQNSERYQGETLLRDRLFHGMHQSLRGSLRYLYDQEKASYNDLLRAAHAAEVESSKGLSVKTKAAIKEPKSEAGKVPSEGNPLDNVAQELDQLLTIVKANRAETQYQSQSLPTTPSKTATPRKQRRPEITAAGPFGEGVKPLQCWNCGGWGHTARGCRSGNVKWRELPEAADPPRPRREQPRI